MKCVQFETSGQKHAADTNQTGQWTLFSSNVTLGSAVSIKGEAVALAAKAKWQYIGGSAGNTAVGPFSDQAALEARSTKLTDRDRRVLLHGDEAKGTIDSSNTIVVSCSDQSISST